METTGLKLFSQLKNKDTMKLTKLQRYTAYCIMLAEAESKAYLKYRNGSLCFCYLAYDVFDLDIHGDIGAESDCDSFIECFPELLKKRPLVFNSYWFDARDIKSRVELLQQCIIETHP